MLCFFFFFVATTDIIVSPERSSRDTMDLPSSRRVRVRVRRRVRRDFLVNALQGTILKQFPPNLACAIVHIVWLGHETYRFWS